MTKTQFEFIKRVMKKHGLTKGAAIRWCIIFTQSYMGKQVK